MVVFVTGKSGSGKSSFAKRLADILNYEYVDVDKIGHSIYNDSNVLDAVVNIFGNDILVDGILDRKKLGAKLFTETDKSKVDLFNEVTGEAIRLRVEEYLDKDVVVEWILLPLAKFWNTPAYRVLVKGISDDIRFAKIIERDNVDIEYLKNRDKAGIEYNESEFDSVIINDYTTDSLEKSAIGLANKIR